MLQFGLRLGDNPRACVTTTPRRTAMLRDLLDRATTVKTHAPTQANRANLAASFIAEVEGRYGGTALGRQELAGELLADVVQVPSDDIEALSVLMAEDIAYLRAWAAERTVPA